MKTGTNSGAVKGGRSGKLPVKRSINLAAAGVKKMNIAGAVIGIVLIVAAATAFGKFAVADRLIAMNKAEHRVTTLKTRLDDTYKEIASYQNVESDYAHYTFSGMTQEELSRAERSDVIRMLEKELVSERETSSWTVSGNTLTLTVYENSLQEVNELARRLETYDIVSLCAVSNAAKDERTNGRSTEDGKVKAYIIAYLVENGEGGTK